MLGDLTSAEVARIIEECFGGSPMPELQDPAARRAGQTAREQGFPRRIDDELTPEAPVAVLPYTRFRDYVRNGNRTRFEKLQATRARQIDLAVLACLLGQDRMGYLHDLLWAECEATWWTMPAHERQGEPIDLRVAMMACRLAEILTLLDGQIDPEVRERMLDEIHRRVLRPYLDPTCHFWWKTTTNNWNAVCVGACTVAALLVEHEPARLGRLVAHSLECLPRFLSGFTDDGGCTEGPSYWRFGFGWYVRLAAALHAFTGGRIDIASDERVGRICRYPLAVALAPGKELAFADAHSGFQDPVATILINRFHAIPELFGLCELRPDGSLAVRGLADLLLYDGSKHSPLADRADHYLPDLGVAMVRACPPAGRPGSGLFPAALAAKAGNNAEHHNHNDVGSFIVFRDGTYYLTDPAAPIYSARTFSSRRYESVFCNSLGHSVPVIAGRQQPAGAQYHGEIVPEGVGGDGEKVLRLDLSAAYDVPELERLRRTITLAADGRSVAVADEFAFEGGQAPSVEEAFLTAHQAEPAADGRSVTIYPGGVAPATLTCEADAAGGSFTVTELTEESRAESRTGDLLRRIAFTPAGTKPEMTLRFVLSFA